MKLIRFEKSKLKKTYAVNLEQVLWVEFLDGPQTKKISFHFASEKSLPVTESQVGKEKFETLKVETNIEDKIGLASVSENPLY